MNLCEHLQSEVAGIGQDVSKMTEEEVQFDEKMTSASSNDTDVLK